MLCLALQVSQAVRGHVGGEVVGDTRVYGLQGGDFAGQEGGCVVAVSDLMVDFVNTVGVLMCSGCFVSMPPPQWKWRATASSLYFAEHVPMMEPRPDSVFFCSSMLNLSELVVGPISYGWTGTSVPSKKQMEMMYLKDGIQVKDSHNPYQQINHKDGVTS